MDSTTMWGTQSKLLFSVWLTSGHFSYLKTESVDGNLALPLSLCNSLKYMKIFFLKKKLCSILQRNKNENYDPTFQKVINNEKNISKSSWKIKSLNIYWGEDFKNPCTQKILKRFVKTIYIDFKFFVPKSPNNFNVGGPAWWLTG